MTRNKNKPRISSNWKNYSVCGKLIPNTRIICSKTPISARRFYPENLVAYITQANPKSKVGLVIDLTDTDKYYNHEQFVALNVVYYKIQCCGMKLPSEEIVSHFNMILSRYVKEHERDNKIICVHCLHGVNRTGYLVCRYLIDELGMDAIRAINLFEETRGCQIEHDYIRDDLLKRIPPPGVENKYEDGKKCFIM